MHFPTKQGYTNDIIPPFPNFKILQYLPQDNFLFWKF